MSKVSLNNSIIPQIPDYSKPINKNSLKRKLVGSENDLEPPLKKGRRKIKIEYIEDKCRRQITFSKRKAGIMKKIYELTTLTGTEAMFLIASETGHIYTYATPKLQSFVSSQTGKMLIQKHLNSEEMHTKDFPTERPLKTEIPEKQKPCENLIFAVVGKKINVSETVTLSDFKDLMLITEYWASKLNLPITCLAGGYPSCPPTNKNLLDTEIVIGQIVAEVDYNNPNQPQFSIEKLRSFLNSSKIPDELWKDIVNKPYVLPKSRIEKTTETLSTVKPALYAVSNYKNAFVNIVFGVRTLDNDSNVVGISCFHSIDSYVCKLELDERSHWQRIQLAAGVNGIPSYHLLPQSVI